MNKPKPFQKRIAIVLLAIFIPSLLPVNMLYASNNGPSAPEAQGFEPVTATDMVNLTTGDMSYMLPVMDVNGFPVTMSYHGGVPLDLESSWVGLGWNLNTGAINRNLNATPDDWRGGNSLDFIRYEDSETTFSVNVGVGISALAEVGVGMSMSSNKGMSGSVYGSFAMTSASIDTNGNYSLGLQIGIPSKGGASFGGGITMSGNVNSGEKDFSVGAGIKTSSGLTIGMGTSLTNGGISASLGYSNVEGSNKNATGNSGGAGISMNSFSQGDWDISSKGWYIPAQIGPITFGFGKNKTKYSLAKGYKKRGYGVLYSNQMNNQPTSTLPVPDDNKIPDYIYSDYQNRFVYGDAYDQVLPQPEKEFVGDYDAEREKINFTYAGYDSYDVNATGISGSMVPKAFENATLFGMGYIGSDPNSTDGKQRVYYHDGNISRKTFGTNNISDLKFYFEGQFTTNKNIASLTPIISGSNPGGLALYNTLTNKPVIDNSRQQQGNFVEVYTNYQINNNLANGLLSPKNLPNIQRTEANKFIKDGIGGYKVTAPDGKIYHFSLPVYHFEEVHRTILKDDSENHVNEKRQYTPYATHWLLTAITGPDYFDINGNNIADEADYGYWVRLDHGKWSDGYVWRTPTDPTLKDYTSNIESNIGSKEFGMYEFGRKQIYYLDKIVSNNQTAYFVKDLRYDSVGSDLTYGLTTPSIQNQGFGVPNSSVIVGENFTYKRQLQLMLKKIVLVNNSDASAFEQTINQGSNPLQLNVGGLSDYVDNYNPMFSQNGEFANEFGQNYNIKLNQEQNVIDVKDFDNFDNSKAIKVIDFQYNYNLAVKDHNYNTNPDNLSNGSPGIIKNTTMNPNHGKLTLKSIKFLGRNNFDYMPPYQFEYDGEFKNASLPYVAYPPNAIAQRIGLTGWEKNYQNTTPQFGVIGTPMQNIRAKDEWGFRKDRPEAWTMTKITTPTGSSINFEHEEDDYYTEAFSRRYWIDDALQFTVRENVGSNWFLVEIEKDWEQTLAPPIYFNDYYAIGDNVSLDLWISRVDADYDGVYNCIRRRAEFDVKPINAQNIKVHALTNTKLTLAIPKNEVILSGSHTSKAFDKLFTRCDHPVCQNNKQRGEIADGGVNGCEYDHSVLKYKLLASKVPQDETGGGLRIKSITLKDENNNQYRTGYYYNVPGTNKIKNVGDYKSSGITSYSPVKGTKFIPYQSELPSAGVMYEYVTMTSENSSGQNLGETRYRFYTLRPVLNIFDPNIQMNYDDGEMMFKAEVVDYNNNNGYFDPTSNRKVQAKSINVKVNTSLVGQFRSIEEFNTNGQLMTKSEKKYLSGTALKALADLPTSNAEKVYRGTIKESFQSMKSIFTTNSNDDNPILTKRMLSVSSKEEYPSVLRELTNFTPHGKSTEYYKGSDPMTGTFNIVEKRNSEGKLTRIERIPAYSVKKLNGTLAYSSMGSKVNNISNKNMLTQEAMVISSTGSGTYWKAIDANITTWNDTWKYRNEDSGTDVTETINKVWRKHKTFAWKEGLSYDGTYLTNIKSDYTEFDFGLGTPLNNKWQKLSEVTRYTRWSSPIETKDINGNFASTKMADNGTKVLVSGNARYTEMYYSGAEFVKSGNLFDGEVKGAEYRSSDVAHTGNYSVKAVNPGDHLFEINGSSGNTDYYNNQDNYTATFRPGKYKVSFWALAQGSPEKETDLSVNGISIPFSDVVTAGCWKQFNYYFDIPANRTSNSIVLTNKEPYDWNYYDDFRMCPISSSLNSYVYDQNTDELSYMLDANNMGAAFKYDDAGRLKASYAEVVDTPILTGGFKITSQYKQNYKNSNAVVDNALPTIDNCYAIDLPLYLEISNEGIGSFENKFIAQVNGGSDNLLYEYKWKNNFESKTYSNYVSGNSELFIPYIPKYCSLDKFSKFWSFIVKVTDLNSGKFIEKEYEYGTECEFSIADGQWADIEINNFSNFCIPEKRRFKIYLKDIRMEGNFKYEYAYYNPEVPFNNQSLNWVDVSSDNGSFCPAFSVVEDSNCSTGYRKAAFFTYKITNLTNGEITLSYPQVYFGECVECNNCSIVNPPSQDLEYAKEGILIFKDSNGKITNIRDTNKDTK